MLYEVITIAKGEFPIAVAVNGSCVLVIDKGTSGLQLPDAFEGGARRQGGPHGKDLAESGGIYFPHDLGNGKESFDLRGK